MTLEDDPVVPKVDVEKSLISMSQSIDKLADVMKGMMDMQKTEREARDKEMSEFRARPMVNGNGDGRIRPSIDALEARIVPFEYDAEECTFEE